MVGQLCAAVVWLVAAWLIGSVHFMTGAVLFCVAPFVVLAVGRRIVRQPFLMIDPLLTFAASFAVFFLAGLVSLGSGSGLRYASVGDIDEPFVLATVAQLAVIVVVMVLPCRAWPPPVSVPTVPTALSLRRMSLFAQGLVAGSLGGTVLTVVQAGGIGSAVEILTAHNKALTDSLGDSTGRSAWALFAFPACVALSGLLFVDGVPKRARRLYATEFGGILLLGLVLYGSRLLLTLALVGLAATYCCLNRRPIRWWMVASIGLLIMLISIPLLSERTGTSSATSGEDVTDIVGYGIFDVSIASVVVEDELGEKMRDPYRLALAAGSVVPLVGVQAEDLNPVRLDSLVAQHIDGGDLRRGTITGFPPSLPTALLVTFGLAGALAVGFVFGRLASAADRWLLRVHDRRRSAITGFWYALTVTMLFNAFKDGDVLINMAGFAKNAIVLAALYAAVVLVTTQRGAARYDFR